MVHTPTMAQIIRVFRTCSSSELGLKQLYCEFSFMQSVLLNMSLCPIFCPGFSGTIVAFLRRLFLLKWLYGFIKNNVYDDNYFVCTHVIKIYRWASIDFVYQKSLWFHEDIFSQFFSYREKFLMAKVLPEVIWSIVHDGVVVIIVVSWGIIVILVVEISILSFPHILLDDLDVLVPVCPCMLMVEAQCMHDLMHGTTWTTEAVTILIRCFL